jgi:hypothetical protein
MKDTQSFPDKLSNIIEPVDVESVIELGNLEIENMELQDKIDNLSDSDFAYGVQVQNLSDKTIIRGVLLAEGIWKGIKYTYDEIKNAASKFMNLNGDVDHKKTLKYGARDIGKLTKVIPNDMLRCLMFEAEVTDEFAREDVANGLLDSVSPSGKFSTLEQLSGNVPTGKGYTPLGWALTGSPACKFATIFNYDLSCLDDITKEPIEMSMMPVTKSTYKVVKNKDGKFDVICIQDGDIEATFKTEQAAQAHIKQISNEGTDDKTMAMDNSIDKKSLSNVISNTKDNEGDMLIMSQTNETPVVSPTPVVTQTTPTIAPKPEVTITQPVVIPVIAPEPVKPVVESVTKAEVENIVNTMVEKLKVEFNKSVQPPAVVPPVITPAPVVVVAPVPETPKHLKPSASLAAKMLLGEKPGKEDYEEQ